MVVVPRYYPPTCAECKYFRGYNEGVKLISFDNTGYTGLCVHPYYQALFKPNKVDILVKPYYWCDKCEDTGFMGS